MGGTWKVTATQPGGTPRNWFGPHNQVRTITFRVYAAATVAQAVKTAQRRFPGWTVVAAEAVR